MYKFYKGHRYLAPILFHHIMFVAALMYYDITLEVIGLMIASAYIGFYIFAHHVGHLHFGHKKYEDTLWNKFLTFTVLTFIAVSPPLNFILLHRQHHKYSDTDQDPHNPSQIGQAKVYFLMWKPVRISPMLARDVMRSKFQMFVYRNFVLIHFLIIGTIAIIDPRLVFFVVTPCILYSLHASGVVNSRGHRDGKPRDAWEIAIINPFGWRHARHHNQLK